MIHPRSPKRKYGFTLVDLLMVIFVLCCAVFFLLKDTAIVRERASRVHCLSNLNVIWKSIAAQDLGPDSAFLPNFPTSNLAGPHGFLIPSDGLTPAMFICPTAARIYGTKPAGTLSQMTASNSSYCYFSGRSTNAGDRVLLCDQAGPMRVADTNHWGLNHRKKDGCWGKTSAQGGNIIRVAGSGMWVSTTNDPAAAKSCITNPALAAAFQTDSNTVVFLY